MVAAFPDRVAEAVERKRSQPSSGSTPVRPPAVELRGEAVLGRAAARVRSSASARGSSTSSPPSCCRQAPGRVLRGARSDGGWPEAVRGTRPRLACSSSPTEARRIGSTPAPTPLHSSSRAARSAAADALTVNPYLGTIRSIRFFPPAATTAPASSCRSDVERGRSRPPGGRPLGRHDRLAARRRPRRRVGSRPRGERGMSNVGRSSAQPCRG